MATEGKRNYRSQLRDEQAAATRARILDAAAELFGRSGYAGTTMAAIAQAAGVSVETVQGNGPKAMLLLAALERAAAGEEGQEALADRPMGREVAEEPDPERLLTKLADLLAWSHQRVWALWRQFSAAAVSDDVVRVAYDDLIGRMHGDWRRTVAELDGRGLVGEGLDREQVAMALWLICLPDAYQRLVIEAGWTSAAYKRWLIERVRRELAG